ASVSRPAVPPALSSARSLFFFFVLRRPPPSTLFPYTTLFRSQPALGLFVPLLDALGQLNLFLRGQKGDSPDLFQVHANGIVQADGVRDRQVHRLRRDVHIGLGVVVFPLVSGPRLGNDVNSLAGEPLVHLIDLLGRQVHFLQGVHNLLVREHALLLAPLEQLVDHVKFGKSVLVGHPSSLLSRPD